MSPEPWLCAALGWGGGNLRQTSVSRLANLSNDCKMLALAAGAGSWPHLHWRLALAAGPGTGSWQQSFAYLRLAGPGKRRATMAPGDRAAWACRGSFSLRVGPSKAGSPGWVPVTEFQAQQPRRLPGCSPTAARMVAAHEQWLELLLSLTTAGSEMSCDSCHSGSRRAELRPCSATVTTHT